MVLQPGSLTPRSNDTRQSDNAMEQGKPKQNEKKKNWLKSVNLRTFAMCSKALFTPADHEVIMALLHNRQMDYFI